LNPWVENFTGWFTQQHDTEPYISRSSYTRRRELNNLWEGFFTEKADFSKL